MALSFTLGSHFRPGTTRTGWSPDVSWTPDETAVVARARRAPDGRATEPRRYDFDAFGADTFELALDYAQSLCDRLNAEPDADADAAARRAL